MLSEESNVMTKTNITILAMILAVGVAGLGLSFSSNNAGAAIMAPPISMPQATEALGLAAGQACLDTVKVSLVAQTSCCGFQGANRFAPTDSVCEKMCDGLELSTAGCLKGCANKCMSVLNQEKSKLIQDATGGRTTVKINGRNTPVRRGLRQLSSRI